MEKTNLIHLGRNGDIIMVLRAVSDLSKVRLWVLSDFKQVVEDLFPSVEYVVVPKGTTPSQAGELAAWRFPSSRVVCTMQQEAGRDVMTEFFSYQTWQEAAAELV
jgi:hypothetical protein